MMSKAKKTEGKPKKKAKASKLGTQPANKKQTFEKARMKYFGIK